MQESVKSWRHQTAMAVAMAFFLAICLQATHAGPGATIREPSDSRSVSAAGESPGYIEQEAEAPPAAKKKSALKWILIGAGVVTAAVLIYVFIINKKYALSVARGEGVSGSPVSGSHKYKKNETVAYQYSLESGYVNLVVKLDGSPTAPSGTIKMDRAHSLEAVSALGAVLAIASEPAGAKIFLDGTDSGKITPYTFTLQLPGSHEVILKKCGYKEYRTIAMTEIGKTVSINAPLPPGHQEDFNSAPSPCWEPYNREFWSLGSGYYRFLKPTGIPYCDFNVLNAGWSNPSYTVTVRARYMQGLTSTARGIALCTGSNPENNNGYEFDFNPEKRYAIFKNKNYDYPTGYGSWQPVSTGNCKSILSGQAWNILKIVKNRSAYAFYINGQLAASFSDGEFDPRYIAIIYYNLSSKNEMHYDYVQVETVGSATIASGNPIPADAPWRSDEKANALDIR